MLIRDLPEAIRTIALQRQMDQGNTPNPNLRLGAGRSSGNFDWDKTPEGTYYWLGENTNRYRTPQPIPTRSIYIAEEDDLITR